MIPGNLLAKSLQNSSSLSEIHVGMDTGRLETTVGLKHHTHSSMDHCPSEIQLTHDSICYPVYVKYLTYRNTLNKIKRKAKEEYYKNLIEKYQSDIRKTWRVLNSITGRIHDKSSISDTFIINDKKVTDTKTISNEFCSFFSNIGKQYAESIESSEHNYSHYLGKTPNGPHI